MKNTGLVIYKPAPCKILAYTNNKEHTSLRPRAKWGTKFAYTQFFVRSQFTPHLIRECCSTLYIGLVHTAPPTNTNIRITFLLTHLLDALYEDWPFSLIAEVNFWCPLKTVVSCVLFIIRERVSTLYVGLARAVPPTNTNFRLTF